MKNISTLFYFYSNFDDGILIENLSEFELEEQKQIKNLLEKGTIKAPSNIVDNILEFAKNYK